MAPCLIRCALALTSLALALGCAVGKVDIDDDRHPVTDYGTRATVLMPGDSIPMPATPGAVAGGGGAAAQGATGSGGSGGGFSYMGGSEQDIDLHHTIESEPTLSRILWTPVKLVMLPFQIIFWPFQKIGEKLEKKDQQRWDQKTQVAQPTRSRVDIDEEQERARLDALEREIRQQSAAGGAAGSGSRTGAATAGGFTPSANASRSGGLSIADELAALRQSLDQAETAAQRPVPPRAPAGARSGQAAQPAPGAARDLADRMEDRDGDGRPDHWVYRRNGELVRESFDEDGDGAPDRTVHFEAAEQTGAVEEDANHDGVVDTWVQYSGGQVARRRADTDGDGNVDYWALYENGQLVREERDSTGDGFRDKVSTYTAGHLAREEVDANGDGRPESIALFDADQKLREKEEDRDGDGRPDLRSVYENGKLVRREILNEAALGAESPLTPAFPGEPEAAPRGPRS